MVPWDVRTENASLLHIHDTKFRIGQTLPNSHPRTWPPFHKHSPRLLLFWRKHQYKTPLFLSYEIHFNFKHAHSLSFSFLSIGSSFLNSKFHCLLSLLNANYRLVIKFFKALLFHFSDLCSIVSIHSFQFYN